MAEDCAARIKKSIKSYPDFPKSGIVFRDVFSILMKPDLSADLMVLLEEKITTLCPDVDVIVGLESRGFLFGMPLALTLKKPFVPIRKKGKLPGVLKSVTYSLEYGTDEFEAQSDSIKPGQKVVIVDDLLATGGTMGAACKLVSDMGGDVKLCLVCIELQDLKGREKVPKLCNSIVQY